MGRDPARIDLIHPVIDLAHRVIRVAGTGSVTERHRRRDASLARQNLTAVLRRQQAQVEQIPFESAHPLDRAAGISARRKVFDISPGQVWSWHAAPQISRIWLVPLRLRCRRVACRMARRVCSHSAGSG